MYVVSRMTPYLGATIFEAMVFGAVHAENVRVGALCGHRRRRFFQPVGPIRVQNPEVLRAELSICGGKGNTINETYGNNILDTQEGVL
jgi:hypothetical protein